MDTTFLDEMEEIKIQTYLLRREIQATPEIGKLRLESLGK